MTESNIGADSLDVAEVLAALTAAGHRIAKRTDRSPEYLAGAADAFHAAETLIREHAGWPAETEPLLDEPQLPQES
ncbi:MAG TPA: hypothetical protein VG756_30885 [Pseudonocardiaceae bacterium]|nr:hypothetical protein [Pseudonocardiaceae bacterium]